MRKIKYLIVLCLFSFLATGCVKYNAKMDIKWDKSMNFSIIYAMDSSLGLDSDVVKDDEKNNLEKKGYKITDYKDDKYVGNKITKNFKNIDKISDTKDVEYSLSDIGNNSDDKIFKVKKGFFKNTYTAKFKFDTSDSSLADDSTDMSSMMSSMDLKFEVNLPNGAKSNNATESKNSKKSLTWDLSKTSDVEFTFEVYNLPFYLIIGGILLVIIVIVIIFIKKNTIKEEKTIINYGTEKKENESVIVKDENIKDYEDKLENNSPIIEIVEDNNIEESVDDSITEPAEVENNVSNSTEEVNNTEESVDNSIIEPDEVENNVDNSSEEVNNAEESVDNPTTETTETENNVDNSSEEVNNIEENVDNTTTETIENKNKVEETK